MSATTIVSIDLGTDHVMAFSWTSSDGKVRPLPTTKHPTLLALRRTILLGREAEKERRHGATNVCDTLVPMLIGGGSVTLQYLTEMKEYTIEVALAMILSKLRDALLTEQGICLATKCTLVTFTIPAAFKMRAKMLLKKAAAIAGIKNSVVCASTTCGALYYHDYFRSLPGNTTTTTKRVAIVDIGAAFTSAADVSMAFDPAARIVVLKSNGIVFGGRQLDACVQTCVPAATLQQCEKCKKELSCAMVANVDIAATALRVQVRRSDFDAAAEVVLSTALTPLLASVFIHRDSVDAVLVLGGTSRVPAVIRAIRDFFPKTAKLEMLDGDYGVGIGAALLGVSWAGKQPLLNLQDMSTATADIEGVTWEHGVGYVSASIGSESHALRQGTDNVGHVYTISSAAAELGLDREGILYGNTYTAPKELSDPQDVVASRVVLMNEFARVKQHAELSAARNELEGRVLANVSATTSSGMKALERLSKHIPFVKGVLAVEGSSVEVLTALARALATVHGHAAGTSSSTASDADVALDQLTQWQNLIGTGTPTVNVVSPVKVPDAAFARTYTLYTPTRKPFDIAKVSTVIAFHKTKPAAVVAPPPAARFVRTQSAPTRAVPRVVTPAPAFVTSRGPSPSIGRRSVTPTVGAARRVVVTPSVTPTGTPARRVPPPISITNPSHPPPPVVVRGAMNRSSSGGYSGPRRPNLVAPPGPPPKRAPSRPVVAPARTVVSVKAPLPGAKKATVAPSVRGRVERPTYY